MNTALITGASAGIGREFAFQLHAKNWNVILIARRQDKLNEICSELNLKREDSAKYLKLDLSTDFDQDQLQAYIRNNKIELLVNNVGRGSFGEFDNLSIDQEIEQIKINIIAPVKLLNAVLPQMKERRSGAVISVSSIAAFQPIPFMATYAATKAFNFYHSLAVRYEAAKYGVKIITLCPGPTATEFGGVARVPGTVTGGSRDTVSTVVKGALGALEHNNSWTIPGCLSKLIGFTSRVLPKSLSTWMTGKALENVLKRR